MGRARKQKHGAPHEKNGTSRQAATSWKRHQADAEREAARKGRRR